MKIIEPFAIVINLFCGCQKTCLEARGIEGAGLNITFINSTNNEYFYPELHVIYPSIFELDCLNVKDFNGKILTTPS